MKSSITLPFMKILPLNPGTLREAVSLLKQGGVVAHPTDTCFGLAGDLMNPEALKKIQFPIFVKPNTLGSSIGVARASNEKELEWALEVAFQFDTTALVEQAVQNLKEVNVAVIGHRTLLVSETEEPQFKSAYQTFEEKYVIKGGTLTQGKGKTKSKIPADLPSDIAKAVKGAAETAYRALGASGISRFDFFVDAKTWQW